MLSKLDKWVIALSFGLWASHIAELFLQGHYLALIIWLIGAFVAFVVILIKR